MLPRRFGCLRLPSGLDWYRSAEMVISYPIETCKRQRQAFATPERFKLLSEAFAPGTGKGGQPTYAINVGGLDGVDIATLDPKPVDGKSY